MKFNMGGLLTGVSEGYLNFEAAQAQDRRDEKARQHDIAMLREQFSQQIQADQARALLDHSLQRDIIEFQSGLDVSSYTSKAGVDHAFNWTLNQEQFRQNVELGGINHGYQMAQMAYGDVLTQRAQEARDNRLHGLEKQLIDHQAKIRNGEMTMQQSLDLAIRAYEFELRKAETKEQRNYIEGRLTTFNTQAKLAARMGVPFVVQNGFTLYDPPKNDTEGLGLTPTGFSALGAQVMEGVDPEKPLFYYENRHGASMYVPGVDVEVRKKDTERLKQRYTNVLGSIGNELWWHIENNSPVLEQLRTQLVTNVPLDVLRGDLTTVASDEGGQQVIQNPLNAFALKTLITRHGKEDKASVKWFMENVVKPVTGMSAEAIAEAMGYPPELAPEYDEENDVFIVAPEGKVGWATEYLFDGTGSSIRLKPEVKDTVISLSQTTNRPIAQVLSSVSMFADPTAALKDIAENRDMIRNKLQIDEGGSVYPTPEFNAEIKQRVEKGGLTPAEGIAYVRNFVNDTPYLNNDRIALKNDTRKSLFNKRMKDEYGIDRVDARSKTAAAKASNKIIKEMTYLATQIQGMQAGKIGDVKLAVAGATELFRDFSDFIDALDAGSYTNQEGQNTFSAVDRQNIGDLRNRLETALADPSSMDVLKATSVFQMLGESLAYQQAAVAQGGAKGRDISDNDVRNWRRKLGLDGTFIYTPGILANLEYLQDQNNKTIAVYGAYANAKNDTQFKAAFLFNEAVGIAPRYYVGSGDGAPNQYGAATTDEGFLGVGTSTVTVTINGKSGTYPMR